MNTATDETNKAHMPLRIALVVLLALSVLAIIVSSVYGGGFFARLLTVIGLREEESVVSSLRFSGESYAKSGDYLAVASSVGGQLIDEAGTVLAAESFAMDTPAVSASDSLGVFYDVGGTAMCIISHEGESVLCPTEQPIRFADVSEAGYITVVTESADYRGRVQVYNAALSPIFTLDCGVSGYPINARVSAGERLLVNCVSASGSNLRVFSLHSESELNSFEPGDRLILDFDFLADGTVAVLTEEALYLLDDYGNQKSCIELEGMVLSDYCFDGRSAVLLLHTDLTGSEGVLRSYSSRGELVGELAVNRPIYSLSALNKQLLVLYSSELTLYHEDFSDDISYQRVANSTLCLLMAENKALLLGRSGGELIRFCD